MWVMEPLRVLFPGLCQPWLQMWKLIQIAHSWCECEEVFKVLLKHSDLGSRVLCSYKLAENIDAQLKRMAQDLKDITEHLNTTRGPADTSDPVNASFCFIFYDLY